MRTIVKGKNIDVPDHVRAVRRAQARPPRADPRRPQRRLVELSDRAAPQRRRLAHRRGHARHRRPDAADPRGRREPPGRRRRGRRQARAAGRRPPREAPPPGPARRGEGRSCAASRTAPREPGREPRIVKTKRFAIEPMFEEDAVARMEELGHQFFVFVDAENERVAILYRARRRRLRAHRADRRRRVHEPVEAARRPPSRPPLTPGAAPAGESRVGASPPVLAGLRASSARRRPR